MPAVPDPVAEPKAYQDALLAYLGGDDPAEAQADAPAALRALVSDAGGEGGDLRSRPEESEWSALECIGHIADAEVVASARYRWILAHDEPPLAGYDQDLWANRLRHNEDDPVALIDHFEAMRRANVDLWNRTSETDRARVGMHSERGPESYDLSFRMIAGHDRLHTDQARRALGTAKRH